MTNETKKAGLKGKSWGKPPASDKPGKRERRFGILGNLITLLLTALIIAGGFMLPTILYPYLDFYHNDPIQLVEPSEQPTIFPNPIVLYPWNIYSEQSLQPLTSQQREFLEAQGIPRFLLATMCNHGFEMAVDQGKTEFYYYLLIINSFNYLAPTEDDDPGCYVLVDLDIDEDSIPDFVCAVDLDGTIIDLRFLSSAWELVTIESPIGLPVAISDDEDPSGQTPAGEEPKEEEPQTGTGVAELENPPGAEEEPEDQDNPDNTQEDPNGSATEPDEENPIIEHLPVEDDENIWSFSYATSREAQLIGQQALFQSFRQLEFYYETRYGYPYTQLLPLQSSEEEALPPITYTPLYPQVITTSEYLLYSYNLPTGERLILYIEPINLRCIGFNLLLSD
ncbi:MAG: hypothetical protein FWF91_01855 [Coriobacteriia bacterium]|nr:hypothetical protein [Coriobacteriia bacterium]